MLIALIGESGCGKTTIERALEQQGIKRVISSTTRKKRKDEINKQHYFFYSREEMENKAANGEFLEYQTFNGELYGVERTQISNEFNSVIIVAFDGLKELKHILKDKMISFYIKTSYNTRFDRMIERRDHPEQILRRLDNDIEAFNGVEKFADFVIDGETDIDSIVKTILEKLT